MKKVLNGLVWFCFMQFGFITFSNAELSESERTQVRELMFMINQRFQLIEDAAAYKYVHHLPTFVPSREHEILAGIRQAATLNRLDLQSTQAFIDVQIRIALELTNQLHRYWQKAGFPEDLPLKDLDAMIRPELAKLTVQMVFKTAQVLPIVQDVDNFEEIKKMLHEIIHVDLLSPYQKEVVLNALVQVKKA